jgi:hypothetical protein
VIIFRPLFFIQHILILTVTFPTKIKSKDPIQFEAEPMQQPEREESRMTTTTTTTTTTQPEHEEDRKTAAAGRSGDGPRIKDLNIHHSPLLRHQKKSPEVFSGADSEKFTSSSSSVDGPPHHPGLHRRVSDKGLVAAGRVEFHVALSVSTEMHAALTTMEKELANAVKSHDYGRVRSSATAMVYMVDAMEQMKITD